MSPDKFSVNKLIAQISRRNFCAAVNKSSPYQPPFIESHAYSVLGVWKNLTREGTEDFRKIERFRPDEKIKKGLKKDIRRGKYYRKIAVRWRLYNITRSAW